MKRIIGIYSAKKIACFHCIPAFISRLKTGVFCRISYNQRKAPHRIDDMELLFKDFQEAGLFLFSLLLFLVLLLQIIGNTLRNLAVLCNFHCEFRLALSEGAEHCGVTEHF